MIKFKQFFGRFGNWIKFFWTKVLDPILNFVLPVFAVVAGFFMIVSMVNDTIYPVFSERTITVDSKTQLLDSSGRAKTSYIYDGTIVYRFNMEDLHLYNYNKLYKDLDKGQKYVCGTKKYLFEHSHIILWCDVR